MKNSVDDSLLKCSKCHGLRYIVDLNIISKINIEICHECLPETAPKDEIAEANVRCKKVNEINIDPEDKSQYLAFMKSISSKKEYSYISQALNNFMDNYPQIKKLNKHRAILSEPEEHRIVRPIEPHQFTAIHILTRNQVFQIISDKDRKKYTEQSEIDTKIIDIPFNREFVGWGGNIIFSISGPLLCDYDQSVFDAIIKIWHERCQKGIVVETNLSEIWRSMGNKSVLGKGNRESLRRSLSRLYKVSIEVRSTDKNNKSFWGGGIVDNVSYSDSKENKVVVKFNIYMAENYLQGSYATLNHNVYKSLSAYSKKIYLFLMSHDNPERKISLEKIRPIIGVSKDITKKSFKEKINNAIKELKAKEILSEISNIQNDILYTKILEEAWKSRIHSNNSIPYTL